MFKIKSIENVDIRSDGYIEIEAIKQPKVYIYKSSLFTKLFSLGLFNLLITSGHESFFMRFVV